MPQIQVFRCPSCGASLSYEGGPEINITCQFCGSNVVVPQELRSRAAPPQAMPPLVPGGDSAGSFSGAAGNAADIKQAGMEAVEELARAGKKIEAIKVYRMMTGVGLKEAKDAVEALEAGGELPLSSGPTPTEPGDMAVVEQLARAGQKLDAIKAYRQVTGVGLREAVNAVEAMTGGGEPSSNASAGPAVRPAPTRRAGRSGGCGCFLTLAVMAAGFYFIFFYLPIRLSGAYGAALAAARSNANIVEALGKPVEADWWLWVTRWSCNLSCSARFTMGLHGSRSSSTVSVFANMRSQGNFFDEAAWSVSGTVATGAGDSYDLSDRSTASVPRPTPAPMATAARPATPAPQPTEAPPTAPPNFQATGEAMSGEQSAWPRLSPANLAAPFEDWPLGTRQDDAIAVTTTTQAKSYLMTVFPKHSSSYMNYAPETAPALQDFTATVDLKFIYGDAANTYAYGLIFRLVNDDYGFFGLQNDGKFKMLLVEQTGIYEQVIEASSAIRTGPGSTNHLEVRNLGSDFVLLVNGVPVWGLNKDLAAGQVGLGVDVRVKGKPAQVQFSNFEVHAPAP
jgi:ribosomal protein L7/L12